MNNSRRKLEIVLSGEAILDGRVSVSLLTKTLRTVQGVIFDIAKSQQQQDPVGGRPTPSFIKNECELFLVKTEPGSFRAILELPEKEATLLPDFPDFGESVLEDTKKSFGAIGEENVAKFHKIIPNPIYRKRVLDKIAKIAPTKDSDYC